MEEAEEEAEEEEEEEAEEEAEGEEQVEVAWVVPTRSRLLPGARVHLEGGTAEPEVEACVAPEDGEAVGLMLAPDLIELLLLAAASAA